MESQNSASKGTAGHPLRVAFWGWIMVALFGVALANAIAAMAS